MSSYQQNSVPLVSAIIPAYNAEKFIERTLNSVLSQTYKNLEVIVVNDGSSDRTAEIVAAIAEQDERVTLLQQANAGVAAARNLGIEKSRGEFIAPIDADDIWYPENIEKQVQLMLEGGETVGLVYSWSIDIDEKDILTGEFRASRIEGEVYTTLIFHDFIANASSCLIRRSCLAKVGGYDSNLKKQNGQGGEDWDLYLRIAETYQFRVVPEFLVGYRKLPDSMSCDYNSMAKSRELIWESVRQKYPKMPRAIYRLSTSSFYMHLARQSSRCGRHKTTLYWIYKAIGTDAVTPFLRLGLYGMAVKSLAGIIFQPITSRIESVSVVEEKKSNKKDRRQTITSVSQFNQQAHTNLKVIAEKALHQLASKLFGTPKDWHKATN